MPRGLFACGVRNAFRANAAVRSVGRWGAFHANATVRSVGRWDAFPPSVLRSESRAGQNDDKEDERNHAKRWRSRLTLRTARLPPCSVRDAPRDVMTANKYLAAHVHRSRHQRFVNREIRIRSYFFSDIANEGVLLYDSRWYMLAKPKALNAQERLALAERNFENWYDSTTEFWRGCRYYASRSLLKNAAFLLHQAMERYYHAAILIFTGYKQRTHDIELLGVQAGEQHARLAGRGKAHGVQRGSPAALPPSAARIHPRQASIRAPHTNDRLPVGR